MFALVFQLLGAVAVDAAARIGQGGDVASNSSEPTADPNMDAIRFLPEYKRYAGLSDDDFKRLHVLHHCRTKNLTDDDLAFKKTTI